MFTYYKCIIKIVPTTIKNNKKERIANDEIMNKVRVVTMVNEALIAVIRFRMMNKNILTYKARSI